MQHRSPTMDDSASRIASTASSPVSRHRGGALPRGGGGPPPSRGTSVWMLACAEICRTAAHFMLIASDHHPHLCRECAEICEECAKDCERIGDMEECARARRRCAESRRKMAA